MEALNRLVGRTVPWLTLGMVGVTFVIVVLRYVFGRSWIWPQELVTYLHALTFLLAAGWALAQDAHVRGDAVSHPRRSCARARALGRPCKRDHRGATPNTHRAAEAGESRSTSWSLMTPASMRPSI